MELPLVLRRARSGALIYAIPLWYRILAGLVLLVLASAIVVAGGAGPLGWLLLAVALLALLYEERWIFDVKAGTLTWSLGLVVAAKTHSAPLTDIQAVALRPFHRGLLDQSKAQAEDPAKPDRSRKTEWRLVVDLAQGDTLVIDAGNPRRRDRLTRTARAIADELDLAFEGA